MTEHCRQRCDLQQLSRSLPACQMLTTQSHGFRHESCALLHANQHPRSRAQHKPQCLCSSRGDSQVPALHRICCCHHRACAPLGSWSKVTHETSTCASARRQSCAVHRGLIRLCGPSRGNSLSGRYALSSMVALTDAERASRLALIKARLLHAVSTPETTVSYLRHASHRREKSQRRACRYPQRCSLMATQRACSHATSAPASEHVVSLARRWW